MSSEVSSGCDAARGCRVGDGAWVVMGRVRVWSCMLPLVAGRTCMERLRCGAGEVEGAGVPHPAPSQRKEERRKRKGREFARAAVPHPPAPSPSERKEERRKRKGREFPRDCGPSPPCPLSQAWERGSVRVSTAVVA